MLHKLLIAWLHHKEGPCAASNRYASKSKRCTLAPCLDLPNEAYLFDQQDVKKSAQALLCMLL